MSRKWVRVLVWIAAAVLLYTVAGFFGLPYIARAQLEKRLTAELERPVQVERVEFNPFNLKAAVEGVRVGGRDGAEPGLASLDRLDVDLAWRSVIERAPVIQRLKLTKPHLRLVREADGSYDIDDLITKWTAPPAEPADPDAPTPRFALANIELEDGSFQFDDRVIPRTHEITGLLIRVPFISSLPVHQEVDVTPALAAVVNGSAIGIDGRSRPFSDTHESDLDFEIAPVDLAEYVAYLPDGTLPAKLESAIASAQVQVAFRQPEGQGPMVQVRGKADLEKIELRDPTGAPLLSVGAIRAADLDLKPFGNAYQIGSVAIEGAAATVHRRAGEPRFFHPVLTALEKRPAASKASGDTKGGAAEADAAQDEAAKGAASGEAVEKGEAAPNDEAGEAPKDEAAKDEAAGSGPATAAPAEPKAAAPVAVASNRLRWAIGELRLQGATVDFVDETFQPRKLAVKVVDLSASVAGLGSDFTKSVPYELTLAIGTGERVESGGNLRLDPLLVEGKAALADAQLKNWWWIVEPQLKADLAGGSLSASTGYRVAQEGKGIETTFDSMAAELKALVLKQRWDRRELLRVDSLAISDSKVDLQRRRLVLGSVEGKGGKLNVARDRKGQLNLAQLVDGGPQTTPAAKSSTSPGAASDPWSVSLERLQLQGWGGTLSDASAGRAADMQLSNLNLLAEDFDTAAKKPGKVRLSTRVGKSGSLAANGSVGLDPVAGRLAIDARRIGVLPAQPYFTRQVSALVSSGELSAKGDLSFQVPERGGPRASWRGSAGLTDFAAVAKVGSEELLRWKSLKIGGIDFVLDPLKVDLDEIELSDFYARLVLSSEGRLNLQDVLLSEEEAGKVAAEARARAPADAPPVDVRAAEYGQVLPGTEADDGPQRSPGKASATVADGGRSEPLPVRVGRIVLNNGNINFTDNFIRPNYSANLTGLTGSVSTITPDTAGTVELRGKIDNAGALEILGSINPLAQSLFLDLKANASDIDLPRASPYSVKYLGYGIEKGKLSANVEYRLENRQLEANNRIILDQLTFGEKVESETATNLPVQFAVSLLKDRNGVIDVQMPIGGSLDDPQFSVGGLVLRMIFNLIRKAVTAPFSLLAGIAGGGAELSQIAFDPGSATLGPEALASLQAISKALTERPGLKLDLSGRADAAQDLAGLRDHAVEALVRAQKVRQMARRGEDSADPASVQVTPEEYPDYLRRAYRAADFKKERNLIGMVKDVPVEEMERLLRDNVALDDGSLRALADARAQAARNWLVDEGGIAGERVFVVAPKLDGSGLAKGGNATGVDLSLK